MHPLQLHLVQSLLSYPVSNSLGDEWRRCDTGTAAVVQYCDVLEEGPLRGRPKRKTAQQQSDEQSAPKDVDSGEVPVSVRRKPLRATRE
ncbi:hypothetical protein N7481_006220 [Penicillium waksmanii]|uniref:uncharacterized protein n=1 Tax=Penicillium waksmanii TaxID=69791 RepID=UPI002548C09D|nr:uncharacterized protein N7481_006220 [Penicillium waksmanii]KAJ5984121.1 hypothetical protein N7481_006220 [Penicillium waksmanii]